MTASTTDRKTLDSIREKWEQAWPDALRDWSPFVQLHEPTWCYTEKEERKQGLSSSFAMIRLNDHSIVISLPQIERNGLEDFGAEILAHEVGHHVYCPGDLTDNARLIARIRRCLPGVEHYTPYLANLYADLLLNDRLKRSNGRRIDLVYRKLMLGENLAPESSSSDLWSLYLRTYEILWNLEPQFLTGKPVTARVNQDALLGSRLIRAYSRDWLGGAGRFACLYLPYVIQESETQSPSHRIWCDTLQAGDGGVPDGLTELEDDAELGNIHPAEDPILSGIAPVDLGEIEGTGRGRVAGEQSGRKTLKNFRDPFEYSEILKAAGVKLSEREIAMHYYRERALPFLIPFPSKEFPQATDPMPEGLDPWDPAGELNAIDWMATVAQSPIVIPGVTTQQRTFGTSPGSDPQRLPFDLYLGVDCSGSMGDPARMLSWPVLAGAIICLSALRAGASVKVVLSGEPGKSISTDGFVRRQEEVLRTMVNYLGTGYSFGIHRLAETFYDGARFKAPVHILIVSDYDMFSMLDSTANQQLGWTVAKQAAERCGGGATFVLQLPGYSSAMRGGEYHAHIERMKTDGWNVSLVNSMEELGAFARQFSRTHYVKTGAN